MYELVRWLTWDGAYDRRGCCNRPAVPGGSPAGDAGMLCLDPHRTREIPVVLARVNVRILQCRLVNGRVWVKFALKQPQRTRALLFRVYLRGYGMSPTGLVYQEVLEGEILTALAREPVNPPPPEHAGQNVPIETPVVSYDVRLWVTTAARDFKEQRRGSRMNPRLRPGNCFPDDFRRALPTSPTVRAPRVAPKPDPQPAPTGAWSARTESPPSTHGLGSAWDAPDPVSASMVRRPDQQDDDTPSVIQPAMGHDWSAWEAPDPLAYVTADSPMPSQPAPQLQPQPQQPPEPARTLPTDVDPAWARPPGYSEQTMQGANQIPGAFQLHLAAHPGADNVDPVLKAEAADGEFAASPAPSEKPRQLVRGIRGAVTIDGLHHTELYNFDHPDNLYRAAAYLMQHHFGRAVKSNELRAVTFQILKILLAGDSPFPKTRRRLLEAVPGEIAADGELPERAQRYLERIAAEDYRGDALHLAALELWLGVQLNLYQPDGRRIPLPHIGRPDYHRFQVLIRSKQGNLPLPRFMPLTELIPDLAGSSPIPYEITGAEVEAFYRDATLSPHRRIGSRGTLIQRVTSFYRDTEFRLITSDDIP
ncbi:MAG: hypothetical protein QNK37_04935 [Acidobacteriota bacterium]|nr:hypothetical protein [Acidobacteriota bacterium]